jgi:two-component system sensor histidine kinase ChiS
MKQLLKVCALPYVAFIAFVVLVAPCARASDRPVLWRAGGKAETPFLLPRWTLDRVRSRPTDSPASFLAAFDGLEPGAPYVLSVPFSSGLSVAVSGAESATASGSSPLVFLAPGSAVAVTASEGSGNSAASIALRGAALRPLGAATSLAAVAYALLLAYAALAALRLAAGLRSFAQDRNRSDELFIALASVSAAVLSLAAYRSVSMSPISGFSVELAESFRAIASVAFLCSALGAALSRHPFRFAFALFVPTAVLGAFACAVAVYPPIPPAAASFAFSLLCFVAAAISGIVALRGGSRHSGALFASIAAASAAIAASALVVDPAAETVLSCAAAVPFAFLSLFRRNEEPQPRAEEEPAVLSDYVDEVSVALTRFVPKEFLAILDKESASQLRLGDHVKKDMTIFFSDIRSFTTLSEGLTPEENFRFINSYLARVVPVVNAYGGFVDKYIGDAIMALFPEHTGADSAVRAAIEMQKRIVEYNGHRANCGYRPLSMGIGLHTGTLMLGVVGVEDRMQSTVISDAVNLASRLESITKVFNVSLAISEETFKNLEDPGAYKYRFIGKVRVKGKQDPVSVFEIFDGIDESSFERKMKANRFFEQGMLSYYQKDFPGAMFYFRKVLEVLPEDGASAFYLDNCLAKAQV